MSAPRRSSRIIKTGTCVVPPSIKGEKMMRLPRRRTAAERGHENKRRFRVATRPLSRPAKRLEVTSPALALTSCALSQCSIIETVAQRSSVQLAPAQSRVASLPGGSQDKTTVEATPDPVKKFCHSVFKRKRERDHHGPSPPFLQRYPHRLRSTC